MMHQIPKVSILMPVYNAESYIDETIQSILSQTFVDFEFLIIDDKSTDNSLSIIKKYSDSRIKIYENEVNIGYVKSLNKLIECSSGTYLARQDNDDISSKNRIYEQVKYLDNNPDVLLCGSNYNIFGKKELKSNVPTSDKEIRAYFLFNNPICHPTVMMRKSIFSNYCVGKYDELMCPSEDYALWFEISKYGKIANLPMSLLDYRIHNTNTSFLKRTVQIEAANKVRKKVFHEFLNYDLMPQETELINLLFDDEAVIHTNHLDRINLLFEIILLQNAQDQKVDHDSLKDLLFTLLVRITIKNKSLNFYNRMKYFINSCVFRIRLFFQYVLKKYLYGKLQN